METIAYSENAVSLEGLLVRPEGTPRAAVLVCHEGPGRTPHLTKRLEMLAELGYAAFALDIYGGGAPLETVPEKIFGRLKPWENDRAALRTRAQAGLDAMNQAIQADKSFALGFSFGGTVALELARMGAALDGVASVYGVHKAPIPAEEGAVKARLLSCVGTEDPASPPEDRAAFEAEMTAAKANFQMLILGGAKHGFANPGSPPIPGFGYDAWADQQAWTAIRAFFEAIETN